MSVNRIAQIVAARIYGPFRETGGLPGEYAASRFDAAARAYLWNRHVRRLPVARALAEAVPVAAHAHNNRGAARLWYGSTGGAGTADAEGLRWIEKTDAMGLRFVGDACDLIGGRSVPTGYYTDADESYATLRAGVWQLTGKGKAARLVAGYREYDGKSETNPGSARIDLRTIHLVQMADSFGNLDETDGARDAAHAADGIAEAEAETAREYNESYAAGRAAAALDGEALAAHAEALELVAAMRAQRSAQRLAGLSVSGTICEALAGRLEALLETISAKRAERESAWGSVWRGVDLEPWRAGFMDESGFVRAVRLGYAKATDWRGAEADNPCGA